MKQQYKYVFCDCGKKLKVSGEENLLDKLVCPVCRSDVWVTPGRLRDAKTETAEIYSTARVESARFSWQSFVGVGALVVVLLVLLAGILFYRDDLRMMKWVSDLGSSDLQERSIRRCLAYRNGAQSGIAFKCRLAK